MPTRMTWQMSGSGTKLPIRESANRSLPGHKRTTYAKCEFFAF